MNTPQFQPPMQMQPTQVVYVETPRPSKGMAVASITLGIVGACIGMIPLFGLFAFPMGILAVIFGLIGVRKAKRNGGGGKGLARAGWIMGLVAITLGVVGMQIVSGAIDDLDDGFNDIDLCYSQNDQAACDRLNADD